MINGKLLLLLIALASSIQAFTVTPITTAIRLSSSSTRRFMGPPEENNNDNEEGLDLDLGEMFEMFDAADKEVDFEDALKKVKGSSGK
jgi:hypothetical protein